MGRSRWRKVPVDKVKEKEGKGRGGKGDQDLGSDWNLAEIWTNFLG